MTQVLETDYLVVGAGASGMAFTDELITHLDATVTMVDRRDNAGGHWNDAYPFVRLHQPSAYYGVSSRALGDETVETSGPDAGSYPRATGPQIRSYFHRALEDRLLASGQVRFIGLSDYTGNGADEHTVTSRLTGRTTPVAVRSRIVDTTYLDVAVPATDTPSFTVDPQARFVPVGRLVDVAEPPSGFTVLGAGKTAMDACTWLLGHGVDPERIRWVRPRDMWLYNRATFQPLDLLGQAMEGVNAWVECLAQAESLSDLFERLEQAGEQFRLDTSVEPSACRGAIVSTAELEALRQIERVVRQGRVQHVGTDRIVLADGEIPTDRGQLHIDCTASGFRSAPPRPIFEPGRIILQSLIGGFTTTYAALVAVIEATRDDDTERNRLAPPTRQPALPRDWVGITRGFLRSSALHAAEPDLAAWHDQNRLSLTRGMSQRMSEPRLAEAVAQSGTYVEQALENAEVLLAEAPTSVAMT